MQRIKVYQEEGEGLEIKDFWLHACGDNFSELMRKK